MTKRKPLTPEQKERAKQRSKDWHSKNKRKPLTPEQREKAKQRSKNWNIKNKEKLKEYKKEWADSNKIEINKKRKQKYIENKELELKKNSEYRKQNSEKINQQRKKYREQNKEKINKYFKNRKLNDVLFRLKCNSRSYVSTILKERSYTKKSRCYEILGCSFEEFKTHLESKFESWMTWENYGLYNGGFNYGWDIDHIVPLSCAKTEAELLLLLHHTNCQPLCSKVNREIKKGTM